MLIATWHQYDDAVFSEPGFWDNIRNRIPLWRDLNQDPAEGRRMAMMAMLPDWDSILNEERGLKAYDALTEINNVVYCMAKAEFESSGCCYLRVPWGFNAIQVCTPKCVFCKLLYSSIHCNQKNNYSIMWFLFLFPNSIFIVSE